MVNAEIVKEVVPVDESISQTFIDGIVGILIVVVVVGGHQLGFWPEVLNKLVGEYATYTICLPESVANESILVTDKTIALLAIEIADPYDVLKLMHPLHLLTSDVDMNATFGEKF